MPPVSVSFHQSCPSFDSLRGRRSKGKGKGIRARDHARERREEGNACKEATVFAIPPTPVSLPLSSRAPRVSLAPKTPFPFPFKRLPRRLGLAMIQISSTLYLYRSLQSLNDLLVSFEFRNLIGCERREERDLSENASSYAERLRVNIPAKCHA